MACSDPSIPASVSKSQLRPGLTLLATPIGNARDVTLRTLDALRDADVIACEDTRMGRRLMDMHGIALGQRPLIAYHEHNAAQVTPRLMASIAEGARVVYLSDAGTPIVADPGYRLARTVIEAGAGLSATPGPCAAIMALTLSGLPSDRFTFGGFSPSKSGQRQTFYRSFSAVQGTLIFYESPRRLAASLADMLEIFGDRDAAVARELSKSFEEVRRASLAELAEHYAQAGAPKGEVVVLVGERRNPRRCPERRPRRDEREGRCAHGFRSPRPAAQAGLRAGVGAQVTDTERQKRGAKAHRTGVLAEDSAARFLEARGCTILARRHRTPHGEIDLIAREAGILVFVEVKARPSRAEAAYSLTARQWARLEGAALYYASETGQSQTDMRFDVVLVGADGICERIENARSFDEW